MKNSLESRVAGTPDFTGMWVQDAVHQAFLNTDVQRQLDVFRPMLRADGGFDVPDLAGRPLVGGVQELHTTTRMVHAFGLAKQFGFSGCDDVIDAGMNFLWKIHRDAKSDGYHAAMNREGIPADDTKLAYGHMFVLLAAATAKDAGHSDADRLLEDVTQVLMSRFWEPEHGRFADEFRADWTPFSTYRGLNANMHGVEAHLAAFEATGDVSYLDRAGLILDFFFVDLAPAHEWRLPEHFTADWGVDSDYEGNPMFRPAGSTPGHSFELARLLLQYWDLCGRKDPDVPAKARRIMDQAFIDGTHPKGGLIYTVQNGATSKADRYWWPVTEAIGAVAALQKVDPRPEDEDRYRALWSFADEHFIDHINGGWFPEIDDAGRPSSKQFTGKPDIYHAIQACLFPTQPALSRITACLDGANSTA